MRSKRILSALLSVMMLVPNIYTSSAAALSSEADNEADYETEQNPIYIPDFPQEVLDEFQIDWTGLSSNRFVDNVEFDTDTAHHKFEYDGGYAMYSNQNYSKNLCCIGNFHDCSSFVMYQSKDFPYTDYTDMAKVKLDMYIGCEIKKEGDLRMGPLLELNSGREELFVVERYTSVSDFSGYEKLGSYVSDDMTYDLYRDNTSENEVKQPVRYYAVNTEGVLPVSEVHVDLSSDLSEHLSKLHELADVNTALDRYGILTEAHGGVGYAYHRDELIGSYFMLPEEKAAYDEDGDPLRYEGSLLKNIDGYRYSFQTTDSGMPLSYMEDGRSRYTSHENGSYIIPMGNGNAVAFVPYGITSCLSVYKEFDGSTSVFDHNYDYSFKYSSSKDIGVKATLWTLDPYVRFDFADEEYSIESFIHKYICTIKLNGEQYELYSDGTIDYDVDPLLDAKFDKYLFVRKNGGDNAEDTELKGSSFPMTALLKAASEYGIEVGKLCRIGLTADNYGGGYYIDITENKLIEDAPSDKDGIYVDAANRYDVKLGKYSFSSNLTPANSGYMYGYKNGCFTASVNNNKSSWFDAGISNTNDRRYVIDKNNGISADYKIENGFDSHYQIGYELSGRKDRINETVCIIEKSNEFPLKKQTSYDFISMTNASSDQTPDFIKTYSAGGHQYDLYKDSHVYIGCFGNTYYDNYISVRKDQEEGSTLEGSIDFSEHIRNIDEELLGKTVVSGAYLTVDVTAESGKIDVLKNDIKYNGREIPKEIIGDLNDDFHIDSFDVLAAKRALLEQYYTDYTPEIYDINQNGTFELADVVMLQSYVVGKIKALPQPAEK